MDRLVGKDGKTRPRKQPRKHRGDDPVEDDDIDELEADEEAELRESGRSARAFTQALSINLGGRGVLHRYPLLSVPAT